MIKNCKAFFVLLILLLIVYGCQQKNSHQELVNLTHLDHLYYWQRLEEGGRTAAVAIYAEYPDYKPVKAVNEGITCVDDIARAAVVYLLHYKTHRDSTSLTKGESLIKTLMQMQAPNGCFFNFIRENGKIEKDNRNSQPLPDWWTWRAFWALGEYVNLLEAQTDLRARCLQAMEGVLPFVEELTIHFQTFAEENGLRYPLWLPQKSAAEQGALVLKGLVQYYRATQNQSLLSTMRMVAQGIQAMQVKNRSVPVFGALLSWKNIWHAWGNSQADALLEYFEVTHDSSALNTALMEIDHFYPFLINQGYYRSFELVKVDGKLRVERLKRFEQIAYDFRPMVWACLKAYGITGKRKYLDEAVTIAAWFAGKNAANKPMYDLQTGRCFDGIVNENQVNLNAGAESTIEALLTLLKIEMYPEAAKNLTEIFQGGKAN